MLPLKAFREGSAVKVGVALGSQNSPWDEGDASEGWLCPPERNRSVRRAPLSPTRGGEEFPPAAHPMPGRRWDEFGLFPSAREGSV